MIDTPTQNPGLPLTAQTPQSPLFVFDIERAKYDQTISQFKPEQDKTRLRQELRQNKRNVNDERVRGAILEDETIIPDRTIDLNIRRGSVQYIQYVTKAKRLLIITDNDNPDRDLEPLELWFTRGMRYPKWKMPWFKGVDGMQLHGGVAMEVIYDKSKPFNVGVDYIPRQRLVMSVKTQDIQANPHILRSFDVTPVQLSEFAAIYNFDPEVVKAIQDKYTDQLVFRTIYRILTKKNGAVYNCWYSQDYTTKPLRDYRIHDIGLYEFKQEDIAQAAVQPDWITNRMKPLPTPAPQARFPGLASIDPSMATMMPVTMPTQRSQTELICAPKVLKDYPIFWFPYSVTEVEEILEEQGRASLDLHVQEALTHLLTNTVNSSTRASGIYASAENEPGADPKILELGRIKSGSILSGGLTFFQPPWPAAIILSVMQALDVRKAQESGNTDFAATARKDANKTATEMNYASQQSSEQAGTKTEMFSSPFLDTYALAFLVAQHQAIFLLCQRPVDPSLLFGNFNLQPAGDIEIVKREEDKNNAKEFFNIIRGTPAADKLLTFLLQHYFPDQADEWTAALESGNKDAMIQQLVNVLRSIPRDDLSNEQSQQLDSIINSAQGMVAASGDQGVSGSSPGAPASPSQTSYAGQQG